MSRRRAGPSGVPRARPWTAPRAEERAGRFVVRWIHAVGSAAYWAEKRGRRWLAEKSGAKVFGTHDEAVAWCKRVIRRGRFGGEWRDVCAVEDLDAADGGTR